MMNTLRYNHGFTLMELMVIVAIISILATIAVPAMQNMINNNRVASQNNELVAFITLARNEAIRRNLDLDRLNDDQVVLRLDSDANGWSGNVVVTDGDAAPGCPTNVIRCIDATNVSLTSSLGTPPQMSFNGRGYLDDFAEVTICLQHIPCSGNRQHRRLTVFPSGQVEGVSIACDAACFEIPQ